MFLKISLACLFLVASFCEAHKKEHKHGPPGGPPGCYKEFKNVDQLAEAMESCKDGETGKMSSEELIENNYDDNCTLQCVMKAMNLVTSDGFIDLEAVTKNINDNAPAELAPDLISLITTCMETTDKDEEISKDACKSVAMTKLCFMEGHKKICGGNSDENED